MSRFLIASFTVTVCILVAASPALHAYWVSDGVAVCTAVGNQQYVFTVYHGAGGAIVAWSDYRTGTADIYVQRLSASGAPLWTANGVAICAAAANQIVNAVISDGVGGASAPDASAASMTWASAQSAAVEIFMLWGSPATISTGAPAASRGPSAPAPAGIAWSAASARASASRENASGFWAIHSPSPRATRSATRESPR